MILKTIIFQIFLCASFFSNAADVLGISDDLIRQGITCISEHGYCSPESISTAHYTPQECGSHSLGVVLVDIERGESFCLKFLDERNGQKSLAQCEKLKSLFEGVAFEEGDIHVVLPEAVLEIQNGLYVEVQKRVRGIPLHDWFESISNSDEYIPLFQDLGSQFFALHAKGLFSSEEGTLATNFSHGDAHFGNIFLNEVGSEEEGAAVRFSLIDTETFGDGTCFLDFATMLFTPLFYGGLIFSGDDCYKLTTVLSNFLNTYLYEFHERTAPEVLQSVCQQFREGIDSWFDSFNTYWTYLEYSIAYPSVETKDNPHSAFAFAISSDQIKYFKKFRKTMERYFTEHPEASIPDIFSAYRDEKVPSIHKFFLEIVNKYSDPTSVPSPESLE